MHDPVKTTRALRLAAEFLQQLRFGDAKRLPADLARQVPYLLRHFPSADDIAHEARFGDQPNSLGSWLLPEDYYDKNGSERGFLTGRNNSDEGKEDDQ